MPSITHENLSRYIDPLNTAMEEFSITTPNRIVQFLAQIAHESGCLKYSQEIASGAAYEGRMDLGNTQPGDGVKFKGRGPLQVTGRDMYRKCGVYLHQDLEVHPELLEGPVWGMRGSCWVWAVEKQLNEVADMPETWSRMRKGIKYGKFEWITLRINGGANGIEDRRKYLALAKKEFKLL